MSDVYVLFWFDVEDYITPESDDALKGCIDALDYHGIKGTFKIVGEKLRVLKARGREDIIQALRNHEVGYHTNFHSVHPTPSEYLEGLSWEDGIREFEKREKLGFDELQETFGYIPSCYGQPGSSWAPQVYGALRNWKVPVYLDETNQVGLDDRPFWYCGVLNILKLRSNTTRFNPQMGEEGLKQGIKDFDALYERLRKAGGGVISIWYHPCEYSTYEFWDGVNFAKGKNPPRDRWVCPKVKTTEEMELELRCFRDYVGHIVSRPGVKTLTAYEACDLYSDKAKGREFSALEVCRLANNLQSELTYQKIGNLALSPAEIFYLVLSLLTNVQDTGFPKPAVSTPVGIYGPTRRTTSNVSHCDLASFIEACGWARQFIDDTGRVPDAVPLPGGSVSPIDFFATANSVLTTAVDPGGQCTGSDTVVSVVEVKKGILALESQVTEENVWGWVIFPEGFDAPNIIELARLQTWSLKPAVTG